MKFEIVDFPWTHGYSESFVDQDRADQMGRDFPEWDDEVWDRAGKTFNTEYGHKKELTDKVAMPDSISSFIKDLESPEFISRLSEATGIDDLFIDEGLYGGGLNIYPVGSHLTTHIDFNYNNDLQAYRSVNLLYYMNKDATVESGGCFEFYDTKLQKHKSVPSRLNNCIFFATNNKTYHGVNKVKEGFRKLLSIWYYTKEPTKDLSKEPHRTLWVK